MLILKLILAWFVISIFFSLVLGRLLSLTNASKVEIKEAEQLSQKELKSSRTA